MAAERTEQVMVRLTPDIYEELRVLSDEEERTVAQTVRLAVKQLLASKRVAASA
jgi:predicted DNA-binding protein